MIPTRSFGMLSPRVCVEPIYRQAVRRIARLRRDGLVCWAWVWPEDRCRLVLRFDNLDPFRTSIVLVEDDERRVAVRRQRQSEHSVECWPVISWHPAFHCSEGPSACCSPALPQL